MRCEKCNGTGSLSGKKSTCKTCGGRGQVREVRNTFFGSMQVVVTCPECEGEGEVISEKCKVCGGDGLVTKTDTFRIKIPASIPDGVTLRFKERGDFGLRGGRAGDLLLTIEVKPHPVLERKGSDIYMDKHIDVVTAVLGGEVSLPTVHGDVVLKIPGGTQSEKIFKIKGKGAPLFRGRGMGDQYVKIIVDIPEKLSRSEREKWEALKGK